jgi:hypothetical protein
VQDEYAKYFSEVKEFNKWHLTSFNRGPMHYKANSMYWFECGEYGKARECAVIGEDTDIESMSIGEFEQYLDGRFSWLMEQFNYDMTKLFGQEVISKLALVSK